MINQIPKNKAIILTGNNNKYLIQLKITNSNYIYIFISLKIMLSKKFKKNILNNLCFAKKLSFIAIDKIHLLEQ